MKKFVYILLAVCIFVSSCTEDIGVYRDLVQEGEPVEFTLDFSVDNLQRENIQTRGENNSDVEDIYLFIFEATTDNGGAKIPGRLKTKQYFPDVQTSTYNVDSDLGQSSSSTVGKLSVTTTQGESFIYAFANITERDAPSEYDVASLKKQLDDLTVGEDCFSTLNELCIPYREDARCLSRINDRYLMSGLFLQPATEGKYKRENTSCTITSNGILGNGNLRFYRLDAMINFNISLSEDAPEGTVFVPTSFRIVNLPTNTRLMTWSEDVESKNAKYAVTSESDDFTISDETYKFSFYMFENRETSDASLSEWEYKHREETTEDYEFDDTPSFKYAPEKATYVEIEGRFSGCTNEAFDDMESDGNYVVSATTKYRIHLGDFSGKDYSNFETLRNYQYTYNVKIKGIDEIIVEVKTAESQDNAAPGAVGEVLYQQSSNNFNIDAHFEVRQFTVTKKDILDWDEEVNPTSDFSYVVETCYGTFRGSYEDADEAIKQDIYWVEFLENNDANQAYQAYPREKTRLLNVAQLLKKLREWKENDDVDENDTLTFDVFIDEYYYTDDKIEKFDESRKKGTCNWKTFCNQPDRVMYIGQKRRDSGVSPSSMTKSICFLSQRSIQTIYNTSEGLSELKTAWGTETVNETTPLGKDESDEKVSGKSLPIDRQNGYSNQMGLWTDVVVNGQWENYVTQGRTDEIRMTGGNLVSAYSCLQRNRDEDGDGVIDKEELKWYLPAVNQYGDLYIGEAGLSAESRLYYGGNMEKWTYLKHYIASTYDRNGKSARVLAEEGFAYNFSDESEYNNEDNKDKKYETFEIRCVRNLGEMYDKGGGEEEPQSYVQLKENNIIDLSYLNSKGYRSFSNGELQAEHFQTDEANKLYPKFQYADRNLSETYKGDEIAYGSRTEQTTDTPARDYSENGYTNWRTPNQRELMILHFNVTNRFYGTGWFASRTIFKWGGIRAYRKWDTGFDSLTEWGETVSDDHHNNYYQWKTEGDDPRYGTDRTGNNFYRYLYGTISGGTGFGLAVKNHYISENVTEWILCPVRDVE